MKLLRIIRNIFRGLLLLSLIFRLFIVEKLSYSWDVISYTSLAVGLGGMIVLEIIIYNKRKDSKI